MGYYVTQIPKDVRFMIRKKIIGRQTQQRIYIFDEKTAGGEHKLNLFVKAMQIANMKVPTKFETHFQSASSATK